MRNKNISILENQCLDVKLNPVQLRPHQSGSGCVGLALSSANLSRKIWLAPLCGAALFFFAACSGSGAVANMAAKDGKCVPEIDGMEPSVVNELFNAMFSENSLAFEPVIDRNDSLSPSTPISGFSYTLTNRGWFPAVGVLDVVVRAYPIGRYGGMTYYDISTFFSSSRHDDFIDVESELDPLTESIPEGLTGIMFRVSMNDDQNFDEFFKQYQSKINGSPPQKSKSTDWIVFVL